MNEALRSATPVDQEMTGEPVEAHGYIVTPVARVRGRLGSNEEERSSGRYGWAAIRPVKATVVDRNGNTQELRITSIEAQAMTAMVAVGLVTALVSLLFSVLVHHVLAPNARK